jgi:hypothetical protein
MFKTTVTVPALPGGANTIVVSDGTNTVSTAFSITSKIAFKAVGTGSSNNYGFPETSIGSTSTFTITGFGSGETVTVATTAFTTTSFTCTTGTTPGGSSTTGAGSCVITTPLTVADVSGGSKTITATGGTSALTATTTYTIKPWAAFYNSASGATTFSFLGNAPTSLLIELHGMAAQTIAANSITVGGIATSHAAVTIGSSGAVGGAGGQIVVSPTGNVPFGNVAVVAGGSTFAYASGNIAVGTTLFGGALISSIIGTATSTGVVTVDKSNYMPFAPTPSKSNPAPAQNQVGFFAYGFVQSAAATPPTGYPACTAGGGGALTFAAGGASWSSGPTFKVGNCESGGASPGLYVDNNGAIYAIGGLGDNAWSTTAAPTTAASYTPTITEAATSPANTLNPSFGVTPWIDTTAAAFASTVDYSTSTYTVTGHGFGATDVLTVTIGGAAMASGSGTCTAASGACATTAGKVPDLAAGGQNVVLTGSVTGQAVTLVGTSGAVYDPRIDSSGSGTALNIVAGNAGSTTILRTGTTFGVHGLYASSAYQIVWNGAGVSPITPGTVIGTFTSTATGGIPVPGVQMTIPADTSGIHNIDLVRVATPGTSFMYANTLEGDWTDGDAGLGATFSTQFGDMLFNEGTTLVATPTVANVGGTTTITGSGLQASTLYDLGISLAGVGSSSPAVPTTCALSGSGAAIPPNTIAGQFTSTATGTVPSGVTVGITDMPTFSGEEQGTLYCIFAQTGANFGTTTAAGTSQFLLEASANLNATSGPIGHNFIETAHGLNANKGYNILFAPYSCSSSGAICGTVVGAILTNGQGAGSATFTIPSAIQSASGSSPTVTGSTYSVQLEATGSTSAALAIPPSFTVSSTSITSCNNTSCMTANGAPTQTTIGSNRAVQTSFTNNSNAPLTAVVYAVVHNSAGQTIAYSTATLTNVPSGGSATAYDVLFGLPPGTYSVTIFATSTGGTAISGTSTVTVTI